MKETKEVADKDSDDGIHRIGMSKLKKFEGAEDHGMPACLVIRWFWNLYVPTVWKPFAVGGALLASSTESISSQKRLCVGRQLTTAYQHISHVVVPTKL